MAIFDGALVIYPSCVFKKAVLQASKDGAVTQKAGGLWNLATAAAEERKKQKQRPQPQQSLATFVRWA